MIKFFNIILQFLFIRITKLDKTAGFGIVMPVIPLTGWFSPTRTIGLPRMLAVKFNPRFFAFEWARQLRSKWIANLRRVRALARFKGLKDAIGEADKIKQDTNCKTMVLFNPGKGEYEAVKKQDMKRLANRTKSSSKVKTRTRRVLDHDRVKRLEKRSLYIAK